jgi:hypothetical protein
MMFPKASFEGDRAQYFQSRTGEGPADEAWSTEFNGTRTAPAQLADPVVLAFSRTGKPDPVAAHERNWAPAHGDSRFVDGFPPPLVGDGNRLKVNRNNVA